MNATVIEPVTEPVIEPIIQPDAAVCRSGQQRLPTPGGIVFGAAAVMLVLALPTIGALMLDTRQLNGVSVWDKPLKFEISLAIHLVTLGLLSLLFTARAREGRVLRNAYVTSAFAAGGEIAYISLQAARGRQSHFNMSTGIEGFMYGMMGVAATTLVVCAFIIGWRTLQGARPEIGPGLKYGAAAGLMLGAVGTLITAGLMSAGVMDGFGHWVGGVHSDAQGLPLLGWSTTGGDLRVPHFFATHAMQGLPLIGCLADRWAPADALRFVWAGVSIFACIVVLTMIQALMGLPFIRLS